ncbi:MAG: FAD-dependent oxidoreductase [Burkholderiales bacterium]
MRAEIVIVGGGAGGLELAARLGRRLGRGEDRHAVLLVDRAALHIWKPTLHEVAAGTLNAHAEGLSYAVLARRNRFDFALGEICSLDTERHELTLAAIFDAKGQSVAPRRTLGYRWLVLAIGSGSNFFGTPGAEHAWVLENADDAERFRQALMAASMRAPFTPDKRLRLAIVGGGATGVELSAELMEAHDEVLQSLSPELRFALDIAIVEAATRILAGLPERVSKQATLALQRRQVRVLTDTRVLELRADAVLTSAGAIPADLVVWAAGIKAADGNRGYGIETNRSNQFIVDDRLQTSAQDVFALGDCAACVWRDGHLVPARAQAAHQQADFLARLLLARRAGTPHSARFRYRDFGSLVSLGENSGIGNLMGGLSGRNFFVEGLIAKWMYMSLHLMHHRAILGVRATAVLALARMLQRRISGRLKLH